SIACPVLAGIDVPNCYWQLANGSPVSAPTSYETGVATHRIGGEVMYLLSTVHGDNDDSFLEPQPVTAAIRDVAASFYRQPHFDYLDRDDPRPFVRDLINWIARQVDEASGTLREEHAR
ncbi:MAG: ATP-grasp domain-containing protein, partial [Halobacteriota archaeon]